MESILDTDLYKLTMQQAVMQLYPRANVQYDFINRGKHKFPIDFSSQLRGLIKNMANLVLTMEEADFLKQHCPFLTPAYIDFLIGYRFNPDEVDIYQDGDQLFVRVVGPWHRAILWETPLMANISELFFRMNDRFVDVESADDVLTQRDKKKGERLAHAEASFADFGTRRRYSFPNHMTVLRDLKASAGEYLVGTSNVLLAMKMGLRAVGTMAHEWFQFHAAKYGYKMASEIGMAKWVEVYRGDLGIALPDTFTTDVFLRSFDKLYAKLFDGVRQDSGDPLFFADKIIVHYESLGIDPLSKTIVFSDGLDVDKVVRIQDHCRGRIKTSFGIGTNLTCDVGVKPMNIVIKMTAADTTNGEGWVPTVKLSDVAGKNTGVADEVTRCRETLNA